MVPHLPPLILPLHCVLRVLTGPIEQAIIWLLPRDIQRGRAARLQRDHGEHQTRNWRGREEVERSKEGGRKGRKERGKEKGKERGEERGKERGKEKRQNME